MNPLIEALLAATRGHETYKVVIPGNVRKNRTHRAVVSGGRKKNVSARSILAQEHRNFRDLVAACVAEQLPDVQINAGYWATIAVQYTTRRKNLGDVVVASTDGDAHLSAVLDALQHAGLVDDDARISHPAIGDSQVGDPRITVKLVRVR